MASVESSIAGCALPAARSAGRHADAVCNYEAVAAARGGGASGGEAQEVLANPEAARRLEQADAGLGCLSQHATSENRSASRHDRIMQRFHAVLEENIGSALYVPDLCAAIGVPERTLRTCCLENLGMSPKEYLSLRRMNMARHDLREADPTATTVTNIAMRYGFWELGRFAVGYRRLFGEAPSATAAP
jgi:transcriptional regulator GlxA family with amidase domain